MSIGERLSDRRLINNLGTLGIGLGIIIAGGFILWLAEVWPSGDWMHSLLSGIGSAFIATGLLSLAWDLWGRRRLVDEVFAKANVGSDVQAAGVERLTLNYIQDVEWSRLIRGSHEIELFISYGSTWRNTYWDALTEASRKRRNKLYVYLPDPEDSLTMDVLAKRYSSISSTIRSRVEEAAEAFAGLAKNGADVRIFYRPGDPTFAAYRFDDTFVVTMYSHSRERGNVPTLVAKDGSLATFFGDEFLKIRQQSQQKSPTTLTSKGGAA